MGDWDETTPRAGGMPAHDAGDSLMRASTVARVLRAVAACPQECDRIGAALEELVASLGLSRASLAEVRDERDLRRLAPIGAAGEHASFAREMPAVPLEQMADAAIAVTERRALYVADAHGLGERGAEAETGVARWRSGMSVQAHALLPVVARDRVAALLTTEWSSPQSFTLEQRECLEEVALLFGLLVDGQSEAPDAADTPAPAPLEASTGVPFRYEIDSGGAVHPADAHAGAAFARVTLSGGEPRETTAPFWDVVGLGGGRAAIVGGVVRAREGAADLAAACDRTLVTACSRSGSPGDALRALSDYLTTSGPGGAWVSAGCWVLDAARGSLASCATGAVALAFRSGDGRTEVATSDAPPLGANVGAIAADAFAVLLPGDRIALCAGSVAWSAAAAGREALARILEAVGADGQGVDDAVGTLEGLAADSSVAPFVGIIEVLGR